jgi:hypothetical protein
MSVQLSLLTEAARVERPRKRVRAVSREAYARVRATNAGRRRDDVLRCAAAYYNRYQVWLTDAELTDWMFRQGELDRNDPNLVRPRRFELYKMGLMAPEPRRICRVTRKSAHPWRIKAAGEGESR